MTRADLLKLRKSLAGALELVEALLSGVPEAGTVSRPAIRPKLQESIEQLELRCPTPGDAVPAGAIFPEHHRKVAMIEWVAANEGSATQWTLERRKVKGQKGPMPWWFVRRGGPR